MNGPAFWDFKSKMDGKKENGNAAIRGKDGRVIEDVEEIRNEYEEFYKDLFVLEGPTDEIECLAEEVNLMFYKWLTESKMVKDEKLQGIEVTGIEKIISKLKNKYTPDMQGLTNVIIKNMGKEMATSIAKIIELVQSEAVAPSEWEELKILSLHKKGSKLDLNNRRGIFISSIISKIFEKSRMEIMHEALNKNISRFQCGGLEGRSTLDHLLTLNAVIDYHSYLGAPTYIFFADAYKCFDKLDLYDCVKELGKMVGWKEALLALRLNENGKAVVVCPAGTTNYIEIKENVRQGTIYGPKLCGIVTDKINTISRKNDNIEI